MDKQQQKHTNADEDVKFNNEDDLKDWLVGRGVDPAKADKVVPHLLTNEYDMPSTLLGITIEELVDLNELISNKESRISPAIIRHLHNKLKQNEGMETENPKARFRRLVGSAAINVTDAVMKSVVFYFSSQMSVVDTKEEAADLYKRASRIPRSLTQIQLKKKKDIVVGQIYPGTDTTKSIILEAFQHGKPYLLKVTDKANIDHELLVWKAIEEKIEGDASNYHLVPLKRLDFERAANIQTGHLSGDYNNLGDYSAGILMEKYSSVLSRHTIPLPEDVLLCVGRQLRLALWTMHEYGYCHMDIKPANIFISAEGSFLLGDYGGASKAGETVRELTRNYYPTDAGRKAKKQTDFLLLAVTLLEMFGSIPSPPTPMSMEEIRFQVDMVKNENAQSFLIELVSGERKFDRV